VEHARHFSGLGWETDVLAYRFDEPRFAGTGARLRRVPGFPWGSWAKRRLFAALADRMGRKYDLVHGHGDNLRQDILSLHNCVHAAHEAVKNAPLDAGNSVGRLHALQLQQGGFRMLICNSKLMQAEVVRRFGVASEKTTVIYPGHDPEKFKASDRERLRDEARAQLGLRRDELVVGLITSGDFEKRGLGQFLRALRDLKRTAPPFRALVVGKEGKMARYHALAGELALKDVVLFREPRPDVERFYHALDVYCHPALYEEFGQSVQEALACGLPVVCGRLVGATELFPEEMRRLISDPADGSLAARLGEALASSVLRDRLRAVAPSGVAANTWEANCRATAALVSALLPPPEMPAGKR
jgi:UDP-glucose:(heptosyl)LPS alpha-1,3-glucosyltransferase